MNTLCSGPFFYPVLSPVLRPGLLSFYRRSAEDRHLPDDREIFPG